MPRYDYCCDNEECRQVIELLHGRHESASGDPCESCGSGRIYRRLSAVPFKFVPPGPRMEIRHND
jgi:putative FmdB family regulatory protein